MLKLKFYVGHYVKVIIITKNNYVQVIASCWVLHASIIRPCLSCLVLTILKTSSQKKMHNRSLVLFLKLFQIPYPMSQFQEFNYVISCTSATASEVIAFLILTLFLQDILLSKNNSAMHHNNLHPLKQMYFCAVWN